MKGQIFIQFIILDPWFVLHISWLRKGRNSLPCLPWRPVTDFLSFRFLNNFLALKNRVALKLFTVLKYFLSFRTFEQLVACPEKQSVPWIHCIEYIYFLIIQNFEQLAHALKNRVCPGILHCIEIFFLSGFLRNLRLPWKQSLSWNFSLYLIYFLHSGCLSNFCLPWKTECALKMFTALK